MSSSTLARLVDVSAAVSNASSRTTKIRTLAGYLRSLEPDDLAIGVSFLTGQPRHGKLGAGYALLSSANDRSTAEIGTLTLQDVESTFAAFRDARGAGSAGRRAQVLGDLFARATAPERDFLTRLIVGELRQGASAGILIDAVAAAAALPPADVRRAAMFGDLGSVASAAMTEGSAALTRFQLETLNPVVPMLAQTADEVGEAITAFGEAAVEWKLDGARIQAHKKNDLVRIYTRNLNDVTVAVPEVVEAVRSIPARELVLDGETIALSASGSPRPFQETMRRFGRRLDVETLRRELPLSVVFFDILRYDNEALAGRPLRDRITAMEDLVPANLIVPRIITRSPSESEAFLANALARGHEGVMAKALDAPYEAGNRGASWLKIKSTRTLDLVVLAAEWGHGRRKGWLSNLHLGARDPANGGFVMLGKTFKGMTDATLTWQTAALLEREISRDAWTVYVRPELVVEVAFNNIQASSQYLGGLTLRFARIKRYRHDKQAGDTDTIDTIRALYAGSLSQD